MTSGVRKFTFSRAVVPLEMRFVLMPNKTLTRYGGFSAANQRRVLTQSYWSTSNGPGGSLNHSDDIKSERGGSGSRLWSIRITSFAYF